MRKTLPIRLAVVAVVLIAALLPSISIVPKVSAHQSGCHRWHSCPSDTGSYVCGDLGYTTYCGDSYEERDYFSEGQEAGEDYASDNTGYIESMVTQRGDEAGYKDGTDESDPAYDPPVTETCEKKVTFDGYAPDEYQDGFYESYQQQCGEIFNAAYETAYDEGFTRGREEVKSGDSKSANLDAQTVSTTKTDNGPWAWLLILGGGAIGYCVYRVGKS